MEDIIIPVAVFFMIYKTVVVVSNHLFRRRMLKEGMIEKMDQSLLNLDSKSGSKEKSEAPSGISALKYAFVGGALGLGLILTTVVGNAMGYNTEQMKSSPVTLGILLLCVSIGFIAYYFVVRNESKK